jgi:hypothetical protein
MSSDPTPNPASQTQALQSAGQSADSDAGSEQVGSPVLACSQQGSTPIPPPAQIVVHVQRPDGTPLSGANVSVAGEGWNGVTDVDGNYDFGQVLPDTYTVNGYLEGFRPSLASETLFAPAGVLTQYILTLQQCVAGRSEVSSITMKRKHIHLTGDDKYGHWWFEMGDESYGWWPKDHVGLKNTFFGTDGELNGQTNFDGDPTQDPHHGDDAEEQFHPTVDCSDPRTDEDIQACLRAFANSYSGSWSWPLGQNCHSFQEAAMNHCLLSKP